MLTLITKDLALLNDIFKLMLTKTKTKEGKENFIHVESMTVELVNTDQPKMSISMYVKEKDGLMKTK